MFLSQAAGWSEKWYGEEYGNLHARTSRLVAESIRALGGSDLCKQWDSVIRHDKNRKWAAKQEERLGDVSEVNGPGGSCGPGRLERMEGRSIKNWKTYGSCPILVCRRRHTGLEDVRLGHSCRLSSGSIGGRRGKTAGQCER
jgi:hypothetical protein